MGARQAFAISLAVALAIAPAVARDSVLRLPVSSVTDPSYSQGKLDEGIALYFAGQKPPAIVSRHGEGVSNRKTNAANRPDGEACRWAMLSALMALQQDARKSGANAVVNIVSYYKKNQFSSATEFECHAGNIMAGVALKGDYVRIAKR